MADNVKNKTLFLKELLEEHTDADHGLTMEELQRLYATQYQTTPLPQTILSDIESLESYGQKQGLTILHPAGSRKDYRLLCRKDQFTPQEIHLLIDLLQTTKAIPDADVDVLTEKLGKLCSKHERKRLSNQVLINRPIRTDNAEILDTIRTLHEAIHANKQVRFKYFHYDMNKKKDYLRYGEDIRVSPFSLIYRDNEYLLLAIPEKKQDFFLYRLSHMEGVTLSRADRLHQELYTDAKREYYTKGARECNDIYNFGERDFKPHSITIRANSKAMDEVIARYGMNVNITIIDEEHFCAEITVYNRKELNAWLSSHPEIRLVSMPLPRKG